MSSPDFQSLVESLRSDKPLLARRELTKRLLAGTTDLDEDDVRDFLDLILGLATLRVDRNITVEQLADEVSNAPDLQITDGKRAELRARLIEAIEVPGVQQLSKAVDLLSRDERVYHDAILTTDIRPIFEEDPSKVPAGAVIVHTLRIEYHTTAGIAEWQASMDENDVVKFKQILERAIKKGKALHEFMETSHLMTFELEE